MKLNVIVNKVYTLSGIRNLYRLGDFNYGEWLIYLNGDPVFYFSAFDEQYQEAIKTQTGDLESFLKLKLTKKNASCSLDPKVWGYRSAKAITATIEVEKLPLEWLTE